MHPPLCFRTVSIVIAVAVIAMLATSCGGNDSLTIYSGRSEKLIAPIIREFEAATGIDVRVKYSGTPNLVITLLEEGANSPADLFFAQEPGGLGAVEGMLSLLPDNILSRVPEWARSSNGRWVGVSGRARTLVYNTEKLTETDLPDGIWDLTEPQWKGRVGWAPRNASFQTMVTAMRVMWGEERARRWLEGMLANDPKGFENNTSQVVATAAGEVDVGLVNHYYLHRFLATEGENFPARNYHVRAGGPGALVMIAGVGILATTNKRDDAERFLQFMLSQVGQQYFTHQTHEYPLVKGIPASRELVPLEEINQPSIELADLADLEGTEQLLRETGVIP